jgi:hypothetical protein
MDGSEILGHTSALIGLLAISIMCLILFIRDLKSCEGPKERLFVIISALLYATIGGVFIYYGASMFVFLLMIYAINKVLERKRLDIRRFGENA